MGAQAEAGAKAESHKPKTLRAFPLPLCRILVRALSEASFHCAGKANSIIAKSVAQLVSRAQRLLPTLLGAAIHEIKLAGASLQVRSSHPQQPNRGALAPICAK